jgi:hypothetical protein
VLATLVSLIGSVKHKSQLAGLGVISGLALSSETAARKLLTNHLLTALKVRLRFLSSSRPQCCRVQDRYFDTNS